VCTSGVLLAPNGENLILHPNKLLPKAHFFLDWPIQLKFGTQPIQIHGFDFLAVLEFNLIYKIYIL